jgi:hypothetical protein
MMYWPSSTDKGVGDCESEVMTRVVCTSIELIFDLRE